MFKLSTYTLLILLVHNAFACTHIITKSKDQSLIVGRTMEFGPNLKSEIKVKPKGFQFGKSDTQPKNKTWTGKLNFIYLNAFGIDMAVDGMNEKGLSISALYLPGYTEYRKEPAPDKDNNIPYYQLGEYILSQFERVDDVKKDIENIVIYDQGLDLPGHPNTTFPLHFAVTEKSGKSIVIEFNQGQTKIYDNPLGVLTNSPTFDWQLNNLKNYANLTPYSPNEITVDGYHYSATGQGGGMVGLPGDTTPPSRFVKMALLTKTAKEVENANDAVILTQHILNNVYIPNGTVRGVKGSDDTETTQWTVFKDLTNNILYFKSYYSPNLQFIDTKKINYKNNGSYPVETTIPLAVDKTKEISTKKR